MQDVGTGTWSGVEFLTTLGGASVDVPPFRTLFLAHRTKATGKLWVTRGADIRTIDLAGGQMVGFSGFPELFPQLDGERGWSVAEWLQALEASGTPPDEALTQIATAICIEALKMEDDGDWMVRFAADMSSSSVTDALPMSFAESANAAVIDYLSEAQTRMWMEGLSGGTLMVLRPDDADESEWGLDDQAFHVLDTVDKAENVGALYVALSQSDWTYLGLLWRLGLVSGTMTTSSKAETAGEQSETTGESQRPTNSRMNDLGDMNTEEYESTKPRPRKVKRAPQGERKKSDDTRPSGVRSSKSSNGTPNKRKRRLSPRRMAIRRSPWQSPPSDVEKHLREAYEVLKQARPEYIFRIRTTKDLEKINIERQYRESCARYHPDKYSRESHAIRSLAEACFTLIADSFHQLEVSEYVDPLRIRLTEKETGEKVVTEKTRQTAQVEFAKATVLFRQKRYSDAFGLSQDAIAGDPDQWEYRYLNAKAGYRSGEVTIEDTSKAILELQGANSMEKAETLYTLGEFFLKEGDKKKAYKMFQNALVCDPQNVGARRRMRLRERRETEVQEKAKQSGGFLGGLFQRRKE